MPRFAVLIALVLAASAAISGRVSGSTLGEVAGWQFASGKPPSHAEYAAVVATCEDGAVPRMEGQPLDSCLADLGLRRAP